MFKRLLFISLVLLIFGALTGLAHRHSALARSAVYSLCARISGGLERLPLASDRIAFAGKFHLSARLGHAH